MICPHCGEPVEPDNQVPDAGTQMKEEIERNVRRWSKESNVTVYQCIGALEVVKANLLDEILPRNKPPQEPT